eukprot:gene28589-50457_t
MAWYIYEGYTYRKDGVFYFQRRVPKDLLGHYISRKVAFSLRTRSQAVALARAAKAAERLEEHWYYLRTAKNQLPGHHLLKSSGQVFSAGPNQSINLVAITDAELLTLT